MYSLKEKIMFDIVINNIKYNDELINKDNCESLDNFRKMFDYYLIPTYEEMFCDIYRSDIVSNYNNQEIDAMVLQNPYGKYRLYDLINNSFVNKKQIANMIFETIKYRIINKSKMASRCAQFNLETQFKWIIENGGNINGLFPKTDSPIFWFASHNNIKMIRYCIDNGSDINNGALIYQLMIHNNYEILNYLINEKNINLSEIDEYYDLNFADNNIDSQMKEFIINQL